MELLKFNETPVRTARNYNINNIKLDNIIIPEKIEKFDNFVVEGTETNKVTLSHEIDTQYLNFEYGVSDELVEEAKNKSNCKINLDITSKVNKDIKIGFNMDENNINLFENINVIAGENSRSTIYITYRENENLSSFHNGLLKIKANANSIVKVFIINLLSLKSNSFLTFESNIDDSANVDITVVDFGANNSISNIYLDLYGKKSNGILNSIYLGAENNKIDMNYIAELRGVESNIIIDSEGALKDSAKKHFKGTIDFKKGCKKAKGDENEFCTLLSDKAKSIALPMLLCSEDEVEGNHSSAAGKVGEKELFYIMSRGFDYKAAMKLLIRARFNKIIDKVKDVEIKNLIVYEMDKRLD